MEQVDTRRELYQGFGDTTSRAIELVVAPLLFALLGVLADRWFGTSHVLAIIFGFIGLVGGSLRAYYAYRGAMVRAADGKPWTRT